MTRAELGLPPERLLPFSETYNYPRRQKMPVTADPRLIYTKQHGWAVATPEPGGYRTTLGGWFIYADAVQDSLPTPAIPGEPK
jgi:hypothetical protein